MAAGTTVGSSAACRKPTEPHHGVVGFDGGGARLVGDQGLDGAVAAGGSSIDARRLVSGVAGTRMSPRVGLSRSNVTRSSRQTSAAESRTGSTPRPRIAR